MTTDRGGDPIEAVICFEFLGAALPIAVLTCAWPREASRECHPADRVVVANIQTSAVGNHIVARAKYVAGKVLASAGVILKWAKRTPDDPDCAGWVSIGFDEHAYTGAPASAIACTRLGHSQGRAIRVFMDRVCMRTEASSLPDVLGHVIAHEIGHALEGVKRHSNEGVMKERWTRRDLMNMSFEPMKFAAEDVELIAQYFARRAALCQAGAANRSESPEAAPHAPD